MSEDERVWVGPIKNGCEPAYSEPVPVQTTPCADLLSTAVVDASAGDRPTIENVGSPQSWFCLNSSARVDVAVSSEKTVARCEQSGVVKNTESMIGAETHARAPPVRDTIRHGDCPSRRRVEGKRSNVTLRPFMR